jgi:hypothetical protein
MGLLITVDEFNTELVVSLLGSVKKVRVYKDMKYSCDHFGAGNYSRLWLFCGLFAPKNLHYLDFQTFDGLITAISEACRPH